MIDTSIHEVTNEERHVLGLASANGAVEAVAVEA